MPKGRILPVGMLDPVVKAMTEHGRKSGWLMLTAGKRGQIGLIATGNEEDLDVIAQALEAADYDWTMYGFGKAH